jgi:predicted dehydrogenase
MHDSRKTHGIAMIGTGMVARTHLSAIRDADVPCAWSACCRGIRTARAGFAAEAAETWATEVGLFDDGRDLPTDDRVDIALILTPPDARRSLIAPLAQAGKRSSGKTRGPNTCGGRRGRHALRGGGRAAGRRVSAPHAGGVAVAALALVGSGRLGALGLAEISVPWWREQAYYDEPGRGTYARDGGGVLISQAIHTIDLALTLTGPVASVRR